MLKKVLLGVAALTVVLLIVVATRPDKYHVERSIKIAAPAETVFATVGDLRTWDQWSPWEKRDPAMRKTFSGTTSGVGASYEWAGNKDVGKGRMTITESQSPTRVRHRLEFIEPFASVAQTTFDFKPEAPNAVTTTWAMDGNNNFMGKAFSLFMDMDKMIGKDFEEGLANLKRIAEAKAAAPAAAAPAAVPPSP